MSDKGKADGDPIFHLDEHGVPIIETTLEKVERKQQESETRDENYKDRQLEIEEKQLGVNTSLKNFTGLLAILSIASGCISIYQANVSKIAAGAAHDAVGVASRSLCEAKISNSFQRGTARDSMAITIDNFHQDQRAWVFSPMFLLSQEPDSARKEVTVMMAIANSGKTPALNVGGLTHMSNRSDEPPLQNWSKFKGHVSKTILVPGQTGYSITTAPLSLSEGGFQDYLSGRNSIYIQAQITYTDVFNKPHFALVCATHRHGRPLNEFDFCKNQNTMDTDIRTDSRPNPPTDFSVVACD